MFSSANTSGHGPVNTSKSAYSRLRTFPFTAVDIVDGFWAKKAEVNRGVSLRFAYEMLEKSGNFNNMRIAAGLAAGEFHGYVFLDSDIYKWLEAVAWDLGKHPDYSLQGMVDTTISLIQQLQQSNGYINSYVQSREVPEPWADMDNGHELYCAGHLFQAAVAFHRALGDDRLLQVSCKFADLIYRTFVIEKHPGACGHPEVEFALVELSRTAGKKEYLDLAGHFIDQRGNNVMKGHRSYGPEYHQDNVRVRDVKEAAGHAVRQLYLAAGVADVFLETGDHSLLDAMRRLSKDIRTNKLYITGGIGSRFDGEAFGDPYELPTDQCYCETCAAIAGFMWNWRMLLITGESLYADEMERGLYNTILSSPALDGKHYFYINPLMLREAKDLRLSTDLPPSEVFIPVQRPEWHDCACCPPNVMRILSSLSHYLATFDEGGIQVHHFASAKLNVGDGQNGGVALKMETGFPWDGLVRLTIEQTAATHWRLSLRIPNWARTHSVSINGERILDPVIDKGYLVLERIWKENDQVELIMDMPAEFVSSNPRVDATRGCLAIQRGPVVYCLEDHDQVIHGRLLDVEVDSEKPLVSTWRPDLLDGVMAVEAAGQFSDDLEWQENLYLFRNAPIHEKKYKARLTAIPYYAWGNRTLCGMRVWIPEKRD
jgi:uncharacterized protein